MLIAGLSVNALAQPSSASPAPTTAAPAPATAPQPAAVSANSTISELQQLMQSQSISEMRTTYNGNYGASLLFKPESRAYYVALFQQKNFWRVVKTTSDMQAEQIYKSFVGQTEKLAEVDIRRIKLEAEKTYTEQLIAAQETRLNALQNDLVVQQQQEQNVSVQQDQARQQAQLLSNKQQAARSELRGLQNRIRTLEAQQTVLDNSNFGDAKTSKK
ncbi:MAG: putative lipoprotein [Collimonas fungivorans]|nr:putative lipoprotein [Collimonas fungivorans]